MRLALSSTSIRPSRTSISHLTSARPWGTVASILRSLIEMGQLETFRMRLAESQVHPSWYAASLAEIDPQSKDLPAEAVYSSLRSEVEAFLSPD